MEVSQHLGFLEAEGGLLVEAGGAADLNADVPGCPDWTLRDLLGHVGGVHRWAAAIVSGGLEHPVALPQPPADGQLVEWVRAGHAALVETLRAAPADLTCFAFLPAPSPLAFWARRQAMETAIHRLDAQGAVGQTSPVDPSLAADGIAELVSGFAARKRPHEPGTLRLDVDGEPRWLLTLGDGVDARPVAVAEPADAVVAGSADAVFRWVWNRPAAVAVTGDPAVADRWQRIRVRWG